jgi:radical SAM-linked protein
MKVQRLRLTFDRGERLRYITHLDLMRSWERALKRAALPLAWSEGFTPHPQIALAAPLPVGATAGGELMDVFLESRMEPADFAARLRSQTPPGLTITAVEEVPLTLPSLQSQVREWIWLARLPAGSDAGDARARVAAFLDRDAVPWEMQRDKEVRRFDLRPLVLALAVEVEDGSVLLRMRLRAEAGGRPEQVAAALGYDPTTLRVHRAAIVLDRGELAPLRGEG